MKEEQKIKEIFKKLIDKLPFHVEKNYEETNQEERNTIEFEKLKEGADIKKRSKISIKEMFTLTVGKGKDAKAHRELKQSEKGIVLIVVGTIATFLAFNNLYQPLSLEHQEVQSLKAKSVSDRNEIETQISKKKETKQSIANIESKLASYEKKYPNYRTQNEVLVLLSSIIGSSGGQLTGISVSEPIPVHKSKINESIVNKGLTSFLMNSEYFSPGAATEDSSTPPPTDETEVTTETADTKFEYTESVITVSNLNSAVDALRVVKLLYESDREIIPANIKIIKSDESYSIEGTLYFYAYRNSKDANNLF